MKKRILLFIGLIFISANAATAQQKRVVTNDDLEKYREKRLAAERDLRENYERLGFPSPEELQKQIEQSRAERRELAARLEAENLQREQLNVERQRAEAQNRNVPTQTENYQRYDDNYFSSGYAPFGFYGFPNTFLNRGFGNGFYGNFGNRPRRNLNNQPRVEYRNNLPVIVPPAPPRIRAPR